MLQRSVFDLLQIAAILPGDALYSLEPGDIHTPWICRAYVSLAYYIDIETRHLVWHMLILRAQQVHGDFGSV